jgi:hypothetical protein
MNGDIYIILYVILVFWSCLVLFVGYKIGIGHKTILINSLSFRQAAKWIFIHEKRRHQDDIDGIEKDLYALQDVDLPKDVKDMAGKIRFEV